MGFFEPLRWSATTALAVDTTLASIAGLPGGVVAEVGLRLPPRRVGADGGQVGLKGRY
jgi:hypothetical protein